MPTVKTKRISATLTVNVDESKSDGGSLSAWIEPCLNDGKSSFKPGDTYFFLVTVPANASNLRVSSINYGSASLTGKTVAFPKQDTLEFDDAYEATLSNPADSGFSSKWDGVSTCGAWTLGADKVTVTTKTRGDGTLLVDYNTTAYVGQGTVPANFYDILKVEPRAQIRLRIAADVPDTSGTNCSF